ncbi:MAG: glycosyltransferase family A protein, partial [Candidatus Diapherotrites archaeon]|nr:glycosyltransferase family A protein [Candidatus Diapherotrites archaeon]
MPEQKIISIGLPVKDEEDSLPRTLKRLLEQRTPGYEKEIIVCLNGSNKETTKIAREFASQHREIVLIETPIAGKSRAWNLIRARAKSDVIVFCDA